MRKTYKQNKEIARELAIQFQYNISMGVLYSWYDIAEISARFERLGKRYGLLREFHENGIC